MKKTGIIFLFLILAFIIFAGIISFYMLIEVVTVSNSLITVAMISEAIAFLWFASLFVIRFANKKMQVGFFVPAIMVDIVHIIVVTVINCFSYKFTKNSSFMLLHLVFLFVNLIITVPMLIFGIKED